jgi:hypothetical protein
MLQGLLDQSVNPLGWAEGILGTFVFAEVLDALG